MRYRGWIGDDAIQMRLDNPVQALISGAKHRAKKNGLPFNLTIHDLEVPSECPYLKVPFQPRTRYAMSLDRIRPELGYVKGNVEIISRKANAMKSDASTQELLEFAYEILERN